MDRTHASPLHVRLHGRKQQGLSLIELMVALTLGAFLSLGLIQLFSGNQETYRLNVGQARLQENARFAMEYLAGPVRVAGFTGCFSERDEIWVKVNQVGGATPYEVDFAAGVIAAHDGKDAPVGGAASWSPALTPLAGRIPTGDLVEGSDVLTIRHADPIGTRLRAGMASSNAPIMALPVAQPRGAEYVRDDNYMVVSDCEKATIFQLKNANTPAGGINVSHGVGGGADPGNTTQGITTSGEIYGSDATLHVIQTRIFYVAPGTGLNNRGDTPNSLWRRTGIGAPVELVEGVEDLQVLFGIDTDGDRVPNRYRTFDTIAGTGEIVTLRIAVTTSSVDVVNDDAGAPNGGVLTQTFRNTVAIRNRL